MTGLFRIVPDFPDCSGFFRIFPDFSGFFQIFLDFSGFFWIFFKISRLLHFSGFSQNYPDLSKCPDLFSSLSGFLSIFSGFSSKFPDFSGFLQKYPDFPGPKTRRQLSQLWNRNRFECSSVFWQRQEVVAVVVKRRPGHNVIKLFSFVADDVAK